MSKFTDGVKNLFNGLINRRDAMTTNVVVANALDMSTLRKLYRHGIVNKIIRLKAGGALKDTLQFSSTVDSDLYDSRLAPAVKKATKWMLGFGRGLIVLHHKGDDLRKPLGPVDMERIQIDVFSGDMVTPAEIDTDLQSTRYYKPKEYNVRGQMVHWTRVIDFTYVEPPELDKPAYRYGGISEPELIYDQIIADGIVQRAVPKIIEKASTIFYKVEGFRAAMAEGREQEIIQYFGTMEDLRGIHSSGLVDADDEIEAITQAIANLSDGDQITLRRLALVCGIPLAIMVGESPKGLNATGESERLIMQDMLETLQSDYLLEPINLLMYKLGLGIVWFKENQGETPQSRIAYEKLALENALILYQLGEDYAQYLEDKDVIKPDKFKELFNDRDGGSDEAGD